MMQSGRTPDIIQVADFPGMELNIHSLHTVTSLPPETASDSAFDGDNSSSSSHHQPQPHPIPFHVESDDVNLLQPNDDDSVIDLSNSDHFQPGELPRSSLSLFTTRSEVYEPNRSSRPQPVLTHIVPTTFSISGGSFQHLSPAEQRAQAIQRVLRTRSASSSSYAPDTSISFGHLSDPEAINFDKYYVLAIFVCFCCGIVIGIIAFVIAAFGQDRQDSHGDRGAARILGRVSLVVSLLGIVTGVTTYIIISILFSQGLLYPAH